jgi:hypothetical protein
MYVPLNELRYFIITIKFDISAILIYAYNNYVLICTISISALIIYSHIYHRYTLCHTNCRYINFKINFDTTRFQNGGHICID